MPDTGTSTLRCPRCKRVFELDLVRGQGILETQTNIDTHTNSN
jgi:hypothetical protein